MRVRRVDVLFLAGVDLEQAVGGAEIEAKRLARGLKARGYQVAILAARHHWRPPLWRVLAAEGLEIPVLWVPKPKIRLVGSLIFIALATWYLAFRLSPRIVQVVSLWNVTTVMAVIARLLGSKVVLRSVWGDILAISEQRRYIISKLRILVYRLVGPVSVTNRESIRLLAGLGVPYASLVHIPCPVDTSHYRPRPGDQAELRLSLGLRPSDKYICFLGRLEPVKRVDVLVNAFGLLAAWQPECQLLIVGDGGQRRALQAMVDSMGIGERVTFVGQVKDPLPYLQASDVLVLTSETEGHSVALIEAMACGLPVVVTAVGGNREYVLDGVNGFFAPPGDPAAVAERIQKVLDNPGLAVHVGENARRWVVENCSLERVVDQYLNLYGFVRSSA